MAALRERILRAIQETPGLTDREITDRLLGRGAAQQGVNQTARDMERHGEIVRQERPEDGRIGNYPRAAADARTQVPAPPPRSPQADSPSPGEAGPEAFSDDALKQVLSRWLESLGWSVRVASGRERGADIEARRRAARWIIKVKGLGSRDAMRVNYFLAILGEVLQHMDDPETRYSIALPDLPEFRGLWDRLPRLAKSRTGITALFVARDNAVREVE